MFSKLKTITSYSRDVVSIDKLAKIVANNPQKELINKIRSVEYHSTEYNSLKLKVNAIMPHGRFSGLNDIDIITLSNYIYFDIDGFDTLSMLNDTKQRLIDTLPISFLCKSVGGKGISMLIKVNDTFLISGDTFKDVYHYIKSVLEEHGFKVDNSAKGLARKMILSSDEDVYYNNKVSFSIDKVSFKEFQNHLRRSDMKLKGSGYQEKVEKDVYKPNDTLMELIPERLLEKQIITKTLYNKEVKNKYVIDEIEYYELLIPRYIKDGTKHKLYFRLVNALYYLNNNITPSQVYSYIYYINERVNNQSKMINLKRRIYNMIKTIEKNGFSIKPRIKHIHFNKDVPSKERIDMGRKIGAKMKVNKTLKLINDAKDELFMKNICPTQRKVLELINDKGFKMTLITVKRNWNKEYIDLTTLYENETDVEIERNYKLNELINSDDQDLFTDLIEEDSFLEVETLKEDKIESKIEPKQEKKISYKYKNYEDVEIIITKEDKDIFKEVIGNFKKQDITPSLTIMNSLNILDKYKVDYLWNIWIKRNNHYESIK